MKTHTKLTNLESTKKLIEFAEKNGCAIFTQEGTLNDFHIIVNTARIKVNNIKPRKYIICHYKFETSWSNTLWTTFTDDIHLVNQMAKHYGMNNFKITEEIYYDE